MVPLSLFESRTVSIAMVIGFAFMVGFYGLPFLFSLYFQQVRDLSPLATGVAFLPMMLTGLVLTPFSALIVEKVGSRLPITGGLGLMTLGLLVLGATAVDSAAVAVVGAHGARRPGRAAGDAADHCGAAQQRAERLQAGTASGVFNTSRQVGGALAIAVFGALVADPEHFMDGLQVSLLIASAVLMAATLATTQLPAMRPRNVTSAPNAAT